MEAFFEKRPWEVFFDELNILISDYMKEHFQRYRKLNEEKQKICELHPELTVMYEYRRSADQNELKISGDALKALSRLIEIDMEIAYLVQELHYFFGWRAGMIFAELTK